MPSPLDRAKAYEVAWDRVKPVFDVSGKIADCPFIYVIAEEDDGAVKIGSTTNPISRLRSMQTGNPRRLRIEYVLIGDARIERLLHELWKEFAIFSAAKRGRPTTSPGTEWFQAEARETLFPIIATAAGRQADLTAGLIMHLGKQDVTMDDMERIVREAHRDHGFVVKRQEHVRLLARTAGYVQVSRPSRI